MFSLPPNVQLFAVKIRAITVICFFFYASSHLCRKKKIEVKEHPEATPNNILATNAIVGKLNEVSKVAEALDIALRDTQNCLELGGNLCSNSNSLDRKTDGNASIDGRESIDVGFFLLFFYLFIFPNLHVNICFRCRN